MYSQGHRLVQFSYPPGKVFLPPGCNVIKYSLICEQTDEGRLSMVNLASLAVKKMDFVQD